MQDKLGSYLKYQLIYCPGFYSIGAAPASFRDQIVIPMWADRFFVGWIFRLAAQPHTLLPRFWSARRLPGMIWRYGSEIPGSKDKGEKSEEEEEHVRLADKT